MRLYRTRQGTMVERAGRWHHLAHADWDAMLGRDDLPAWLDQTLDKAQPIQPELHDDGTPADVLAPILSQEVWACGVTYYRSRDARMAESAKAGGDTFYDRVYTAPRPEIFFKATPHRTAGHRQPVRIPDDSFTLHHGDEIRITIDPIGTLVNPVA